MSVDFARAGITAAAVYAAAYGLKSAAVKLDYFTAKDFGVWWPFIDNDLLIGIDDFRRSLGVPVTISPAPGAIGRTSGKDKNSQHYLLSGGKVRAVDVMIPNNVPMETAFNVAKNIGVFAGIGLYPDWRPTHGLHLDTRTNKTPQNPATWSGIRTASGQVYRSVSEGFA
jgi:hypothetical protein